MKWAKHILAPTDFSSASLVGLERAHELAASTGATLSLLHVPDPMGVTPPPDLEQSERTRAERVMNLERDIARALRELVERRLGDLKDVETHLRAGANAAATICDFAGERNVDLIVIATHGRTGLSRMLIGSVAERVVRHSPCPVLVVPARPDQ